MLQLAAYLRELVDASGRPDHGEARVRNPGDVQARDRSAARVPPDSGAAAAPPVDARSANGHDKDTPRRESEAGTGARAS